MMTGEWNVSDLSDIHATAVERKRQVEAWRECTPRRCSSATVPFTGEGLPGVSGLATGPRRLPEQRTEGCKGAILASSIWIAVGRWRRRRLKVLGRGRDAGRSVCGRARATVRQ